MSESPTEHFEHADHAHHAASDPFLARVSIMIAFLAVLSAAVGSLETIETAQTISTKTDAAIRQNLATDLWGQFSRESLKKSMYDLALDEAPSERKDALKAKSADYETRSRASQDKAKEIEKAVQAENEASERHEHRHLILTVAATLLHIAIAVATIAIVMAGRRWPFNAAIALGLAGVIGGIVAYL